MLVINDEIPRLLTPFVASGQARKYMGNSARRAREKQMVIRAKKAKNKRVNEMNKAILARKSKKVESKKDA